MTETVKHLFKKGIDFDISHKAGKVVKKLRNIQHFKWEKCLTHEIR